MPPLRSGKRRKERKRVTNPVSRRVDARNRRNGYFLITFHLRVLPCYRTYVFELGPNSARSTYSVTWRRGLSIDHRDAARSASLKRRPSPPRTHVSHYRKPEAAWTWQQIGLYCRDAPSTPEAPHISPYIFNYRVRVYLGLIKAREQCEAVARPRRGPARPLAPPGRPQRPAPPPAIIHTTHARRTQSVQGSAARPRRQQDHQSRANRHAPRPALPDPACAVRHPKKARAARAGI